jgi:hypothetical protein
VAVAVAVAPTLPPRRRWTTIGTMNVTRLAPGLAWLVLLTGCGAEQRSLSEVERDADVVVRAELRPGSSGEDAAELGEKYITFAGVAGTRGDRGDTLTLFLSPQATEDEAEAVSQALSRESRVEQVEVERKEKVPQ